MADQQWLVACFDDWWRDNAMPSEVGNPRARQLAFDIWVAAHKASAAHLYRVIESGVKSGSLKGSGFDEVAERNGQIKALNAIVNYTEPGAQRLVRCRGLLFGTGEK